MPRAIVGVALSLTLAVPCALLACGADVDAGPAERSPSPGGSGTGLLVGTGTVLDDGDGPEFCLSSVATSYPPQCGGPPLVGWQWPAQGVERADDVTWMNTVAVVGRFDGRAFTVVRTVDPQQVQQPEPQDRDNRSPCPTPAGGWLAPDPARASAHDQDRVFAAAERLPDYAESWIDDRGASGQQPEDVVVNVRVTGDVGVAERTLRTVWGGSLCVSSARHTRAELDRIVEQLSASTDLLSAGPDTDGIGLVVVHDDGRLQRELDRSHGAGLIRVHSVLQPHRG